MSEIGEKLRNLAFQRRSNDYLDVIRLLSVLQKRKIQNEILDSTDYEAIDIAQAYLREVSEPRKSSN